jgi:hypothetical protein
MSLEQQCTEAIECVLKYHGYTDEDIINSSYQCNPTYTNEELTPPDDIDIYRAHCIDLSYNNDKCNYNDELYLTQQKVKNLEKALRLAKEKIGDLWMELYNERRAREELEEKISKITFV